MTRINPSLIQAKTGLDPSGPQSGPAALDGAPPEALFGGGVW